VKQTIDVSMGPLSRITRGNCTSILHHQADLAGPLQAFSQHHRRTTIKIWLLVFYCETTTCLKIKVMEDYSSTSFLKHSPNSPVRLATQRSSLSMRGNKVEFKTCPVGRTQHAQTCGTKNSRDSFIN